MEYEASLLYNLRVLRIAKTPDIGGNGAVNYYITKAVSNLIVREICVAQGLHDAGFIVDLGFQGLDHGVGFWAELDPTVRFVLSADLYLAFIPIELQEFQRIHLAGLGHEIAAV